MVIIGNHMKLTLTPDLRERAREFYATVCECRTLASPRPDLDLYQFEGGFVVGIFFAPAEEVLTEAEYLKSAWLEIKASDPAAWKQRLLAFGVRELPYEDTSRFYFQAPGGQVFRIAPLDGGI